MLWTAALFVVLELVSNNVVEPWVYGSRTGLSPLAIIVAAIFWTWLWGPMGLLLSTPLTVCLVVLGRHVPQFEFLDVLLGNEPVLDPHQQLYQRLLAGDPTEATDRAEAYLEENTILSFYETVAVPALALAEEDRSRGVLTDERRSRVAESAQTLVDNLDDFAQVESNEESEPKQALAIEPTTKLELPLPNGEGRVIACAGGRGELDDAAAAMLVQVLKAQGATASYMEHTSLSPGRIRQLSIDGLETIVIVFLNPSSVQHARYMTRRLKRSRPSLRVGVLLCNKTNDTIEPIKLIAEVGDRFCGEHFGRSRRSISGQSLAHGHQCRRLRLHHGARHPAPKLSKLHKRKMFGRSDRSLYSPGLRRPSDLDQGEKELDGIGHGCMDISLRSEGLLRIIGSSSPSQAGLAHFQRHNGSLSRPIVVD